MTNTILAIDASNLIHRLHAVLSTGGAEPSSAALQQALTDYVRRTRHRTGARTVVSALDSRPTWRARLYTDYKQGRREAPDALKTALASAADLMRAAGTRVYSAPDHEADDVLATMAHKHPGRTVIVSGDLDLYQTVNGRVQILKGAALIGPDDVRAHLHVTPQQVPLLKAIQGDKSDNIPGVRGLGRAAAQQICAGGALTPDDVLTAAHAGAFTPRICTHLLTGERDLRRWHTLTTLRVTDLQEHR